MKLAGLEIFRAGEYPQGTFTTGDLDAIVQAYDPALLRAPVTIDHDQYGQAYGWVDSVKRKGKVLVADLSDLDPGFMDAVERKRFSTRSVEIYPEFAETKTPYLKAVTFLGAGIPQVKGLAPVEFEESAKYRNFAFTDSDHQETEEVSAMGKDAQMFTEAERTDFANTAVEGVVERFTAIDGEVKDVDTAVARFEALTAENKNLNDQITTAAVEQFVDSLIADRKVTPGQRDDEIGIAKQIGIEAYKEHAKNKPVIANFEEIGSTDGAETVEDGNSDFVDAFHKGQF